jgi:hypothetical protein
VWASTFATAGLWWLFQPAYSALFSGWFDTAASRGALAEGMVITLGLSLLVGEIGLLTSVRCKNTATAVVMAALIAVPVGMVGTAGLGGSLLMCSGLRSGVEPFGTSPPLTPTREVVYLLFYLSLFVCICGAVWASFMQRMET